MQWIGHKAGLPLKPSVRFSRQDDLKLLFPTKNQWQGWSLPSKLTAIGAYVGILGIVLSIVFFIYSFNDNFSQENTQFERLDSATAITIEQLLDQVEKDLKPKDDVPTEAAMLYKRLGEEIKIDPFNERALLVRGQYAYQSARVFGEDGYRRALQDFRKANELNEKLADPYFGIGFVYYDLAIFDMIKRKRYRVHKKGRFIFNEDSPLPDKVLPVIEIYVDERIKSALDAALREFQLGKSRRQDYSKEKQFIGFDPVEVDRTINSIRVLMEYEPGQVSTNALFNPFSLIIAKLENDGVKLIYEFKNDEDKPNTANSADAKNRAAD